tara:strand:+ start:195 stop:461 length:267 start_codon:yes stop_codon:yes gene_type:complete
MEPPQKVLIQPKRRSMAKYHVDRDKEYMREMWGTTSLITDYWNGPTKNNDPEEMDLNEVMYHKAKPKKDLNEQEIFDPEEYNDIPNRY